MTIKYFILLVAIISLNANAQQIRQNFEEVDRNGDSLIELSEMKRFYMGKTNRNGGQVNAEAIFNSKDLNEDGVLSKSEFTQAGMRSVANSKPTKKRPLSKKDTFKKMDKDNDGVIDLKEMEVFFKNRKNRQGDPINANRLFKFRDKNKDGEITLEEFEKPMHSNRK